MPRKTKILPKERSDFSFGCLVFWHFFVYGTRPDGDPANKIGRLWAPQKAAHALGISVRQLWNWVDDSHLPYDTVAVERELFGASTRFDDQRVELQAALRETRGQNTAKVSAAKSSAGTAAPTPLPVPVAGRDLVVYAIGDDEVGATVQLPEIIGNYREKAPSGGPLVPTEPVQAYYIPKTPPPPPPPQPRQRRRSLVTIWVPVGVLLIGGAYLAFRPAANDTQTATAEDKRNPPRPPDPPAEKKVESPPKPVPPQRPTTDEERRAAEERRIQEQGIEARKAAYDADLRRRNQEALRLDQEAQTAAKAQQDREANGRTLAGLGFTVKEYNTVNGQSIGYVLAATLADCAIACTKDSCDAFAYQAYEAVSSNSKGRACYRFKAPLTFSANPGYAAGLRVADADATSPPPIKTAQQSVDPVEQIRRMSPYADEKKSVPTDGVTQCASGPVKATGFKITCDRILSGGTTLGSAQLSYTVVNINECAAKCRPIARCVGFTFNAADPPGRQACTLFGPTPEGRQASGWIAATRP